MPIDEKRLAEIEASGDCGCYLHSEDGMDRSECVVAELVAELRRFMPKPPVKKKEWTHSICQPCWNSRNPDRRAVTPLVDGRPEVCCYCGKPTAAGIYVRQSPDQVRCGGDHNDDETPTEGAET